MPFDPSHRFVFFGQSVVDFLVWRFEIHIPVAFDWYITGDSAFCFCGLLLDATEAAPGSVS